MAIPTKTVFGVLEGPLLSDIEDWTLALTEDEFVRFKLARPVLGKFYERDVSFNEISAIVGRLSALRLIRWRISQRGRTHFRSRAPKGAQHNGSAAFTATVAGKAHLAAPRHVT